MASLHLGLLLLQLNRPGEAQLSFEAAVRHSPRSTDLRAHLVMVLAQTGQNNKAIQQGTELVALDPNSFDARFNLGLLMIAQRQFADGLAQLLEARKLRPDDPRLLPQIQRAEAGLKLSGQ
jgi:Flp pilus assembly protein TadD